MSGLDIPRQYREESAMFPSGDTSSKIVSQQAENSASRSLPFHRIEGWLVYIDDRYLRHVRLCVMSSLENTRFTSTNESMIYLSKEVSVPFSTLLSVKPGWHSKSNLAITPQSKSLIDSSSFRSTQSSESSRSIRSKCDGCQRRSNLSKLESSLVV